VTAAPAIRAKAELERRRRATVQAGPAASAWTATGATYVNSTSGKPYAPHHADEHRYVYHDGPRYLLAKGGEGGGKSVALIIKVLERLRTGQDGIMGSPDLPHFRRSLWPEFKRWCPWSQVIDGQQRRGKPEWEPSEPFTLTFKNGARLWCGGFEDPGAWEGPNVSFAAIDEARRKKDASILKVLDGRVRIPGPHGEPPQLFIATTPRKHWLYDYFGPVQEHDPFLAFKSNALVIDLLTRDNEVNLSPGFTEQRRQSLTEAEARVLLEAAWEDVDDVDRFLSSMIWWDACREDLPPLLPVHRTPLVLAADGAVSGDTFGLIGLSRHPVRPGALAVRLVRSWVPQGQALDFDLIESEIRALCRNYNVLQLAYDPYQLHQMMSGLHRQGVVQTVPFNQGADRLVADKQLLDLIMQRQIIHDGNLDLRAHIDHADRKTTDERTLRIVKRLETLKIDLAVCLSMAAAQILNVGTGWSEDTMKTVLQRVSQ
jgi:hypothetical protein